MRKALTALLSVVVGTTLAVFVASPAHAADANFPGLAGYLNLWDDTNYTDTWKVFQASDNDLHGNNFNDKASSVVNKTDDYWLLFDDDNYQDRAVCVRPHSRYYKLANAGFNDKTSSVWRGSTSSSLTCGWWPVIGVLN